MTSANAAFGNANNLTVFNLSARNREAEKIIKDYATGHVKLDVAIGLAGLIPVPGAGTASLVAAIAAQSPLVYQPMSRKLAAVFCATPNDVTNGMIKDTAVLGGKADIAIAFATDFMAEIAKELLPELGAGLALSAIPFFGGIAAAALDATVAATLTWRVGTMVAIYGSGSIESDTFDFALGWLVVLMQEQPQTIIVHRVNLRKRERAPYQAPQSLAQDVVEPLRALVG